MIVDFSDYGFGVDEEDDDTTISALLPVGVDNHINNDVVYNNNSRNDTNGQDEDSIDVDWSSDEEINENNKEDLIELESSHEPDYLTSPAISNPAIPSSPAATTDVESISSSDNQEIIEIESRAAVESSTQSQQDDEVDSNHSNSSSSCSVSCSHNLEEDQTQMRRIIMSIRQDTSLTEYDKRIRIQALMDGTATPGQENGNQQHHNSTSPAAEFAGEPNCPHYDCKCRIVAPCCNKIYGCRICHDEDVEQRPGNMDNNHGPLDRFTIEEILCRQCGMRQNAKTNMCRNRRCNVIFAEYHCILCNLWMSETPRPFHCADCGICRIGGRENFIHCQDCCMCLSTNIYPSHKCIAGKFKNDCPVCQENLFTSRQVPQDLPCGHVIHSHCFRTLSGYDYRCPMCKKTVASPHTMATVWASRAREIELQPMPPDLRRTVNIICNDCGTRGTNASWHFLGVRCANCLSFNTIVEDAGSG